MSLVKLKVVFGDSHSVRLFVASVVLSMVVKTRRQAVHDIKLLKTKESNRVIDFYLNFLGY